MAIEEKNISHRLYIIAGGMFLFALLIAIKLIDIQFIDGDKYRELAHKNTTKNFVINANRGNVYADDGSLLATSVPKYDIRFDAVTVSSERFKENLVPLSKAMSKMFGKPASYYQNVFRKARANKNRYLLVAKNLGYSDYIKVKSMPLFKLGPYKGGIIVEQRTVREHPIGKIAERMVGSESTQKPGYYAVGLEGAFNEYLHGKDGKRLKQKIAKGQWKPVYDDNEVEPQDGYDVISTININIQDIAHHALLKQLEYYEAEHGSVIVMDVKTGEIKAVSNLGRTKDGSYYEKLNYAIGESHEPGSTFKVMAMLAAMEDKVIDTSTVVDTRTGSKSFYGKTINDSHRGGYGKISAARAMEVSSNIGLATIIDEAYSKNPEKFINRLKEWKLDQPIGIPIKGEGKPMIPEPGHSKWSRNALPSLAYGYNLRLTPLQTLTFYNAIANDGVMVKPQFVREIRAWNRKIDVFETEVTNKRIASEKSIKEMQEILKNVVKRGTGRSLYSENFSMAGKTGTAQTEYWMKDWKNNRRYVSSFAGYFPAENAKYSCIVIIHKPSIRKGFYGADVSGPVFKRIAQKIFTDSPLIAEIADVDSEDAAIKKDFEGYYKKAQKKYQQLPNVIGMAGMDAVSLLENLGLKVKIVGSGTVSSQSIKSGAKIEEGKQIVLSLS
ncbi:penicillin-binding protein [Ulvibacter litoralis]|uniref:Cell division protein FtsI (Penicillin-binding protein 3) n=1 Tax=Ulvibacter litoralis TaxID=227084 RepID=A0A1G7GEA1_9FLAO|nr:penicillin-binding protein [Ulvibacter litoralis]GHC56539.1 penicillin-binding protein [Ulvibacter litoralis]SDE86477.1 cell division protein FtsI (penicillin-binding protein 3) [Ulvibacter litoralis]